MMETATIAPVVKSVHVACSPEHAFEVFTREIGSWWPLETHAIHPGDVRRVVWEEHEGGAVYEISTGGERANWATVIAWDPPNGVTFSWHVNRAATDPTEVDVRFVPEAGGTRVDLEHRHWERLGAAAAETRAGYDSGWDTVLDRLVAHVE